MMNKKSIKNVRDYIPILIIQKIISIFHLQNTFNYI